METRAVTDCKTHSPDHLQNVMDCTLVRDTPLVEVLCKSVHYYVRNPGDWQTGRPRQKYSSNTTFGVGNWGNVAWILTCRVLHGNSVKVMLDSANPENTQTPTVVPYFTFNVNQSQYYLKTQIFNGDKLTCNIWKLSRYALT